MRCRLVTIFAVVSLVLFVATCVLWVRSRYRWDQVRYTWTAFNHDGRFGMAESHDGRIKLTLGRWTTPCLAERPVDHRITLDSYAQPLVLKDISPTSIPLTFDEFLFAFPPVVHAVKGLGYTQVVVCPQAGFMGPGAGSWRKTYYLLFASDWLVVVTTALLPAISVWQWCRTRRAIRRGCCRSCGYDLHATPDRCPECGSVPAHNGPVAHAKS